MRLFVGIPLAAAVVDELTRVTQRLRAKDDGLRWSSPESWHITLQFLGNTGRDQYECALARLREIHLPAAPIQLGAMGFFDRAGIFFAGVKVSPELVSLERHVVAATTLCGFTPETRPYHPHITLARSKGKASEPALRKLKKSLVVQFGFTPFIAAEFLLYESKPTPTGSHYEVRDRIALARNLGG
jgi:2''-5'' RNA ligase